MRVGGASDAVQLVLSAEIAESIDHCERRWVRAFLWLTTGSSHLMSVADSIGLQHVHHIPPVRRDVRRNFSEHISRVHNYSSPVHQSRNHRSLILRGTQFQK